MQDTDCLLCHRTFVARNNTSFNFGADCAQIRWRACLIMALIAIRRQLVQYAGGLL